MQSNFEFYAAKILVLCSEFFLCRKILIFMQQNFYFMQQNFDFMQQIQFYATKFLMLGI